MPETVKDILKDELGRLQSDIIKRHEQSGQVATGRTKASFSNYLTSENSGVLEGAMYAGTLERGRGAAKGKGSGQSNFLQNLKEWIVVRGLEYKDEADLERLAKFLKWWINKNGTKLFSSGKTIDIFTTPLNEFTERLSGRLGKNISGNIENEIFKK